jgi:peptidoglycan/LPS O-acetylase OafA/YrhL
LLLISFAIRHEIFFDESVAETVKDFAKRRHLRPLRLANFAALAYVTARLAASRPRWLEWRWLAYLGQHSLQVFAFSVATAYAGQSARGADDGVQVLTALGVVASLTLPAWVHARYRATRRARAAPLAPPDGRGE